MFYMFEYIFIFSTLSTSKRFPKILRDFINTPKPMQEKYQSYDFF